MKLKCPVCGEQLIKDEHTYACGNNHVFDISKEGYINLLRKQGGRIFGDSTEMIQARHDFLAGGYYQPLLEELLVVIKNCPGTALLDCGCGEGYYTNHIKAALPTWEVVGIDIAKRAVRYAQRNADSVRYIVAGNQDIPLISHEADIVLDCFAPVAAAEFLRVLKPNGYLITVTPGPRHLWELKEQLYEHAYINEIDETITGFTLVSSRSVSFTMNLNDPASIHDLFVMTPYYQRTKTSDIAKLTEISAMTIRAEFIIGVYQRAK